MRVNCIYIISIHISPGVDCVIVKSGRRICGSGAALASAPIVQDKAYFEMKIQCTGMTTISHVCTRVLTRVQLASGCGAISYPLMDVG